MSKSGRPDVKNVAYFPHFTVNSSELKFLEMKHGSEGYRAYYRLLETVAKTDDHYIKLETENQILTFRYEMNIEVEILDDIIYYLVDVDFIDKHLYQNEKVIWIQSFVDKLRPVYSNRRKELPQSPQKNRVSTCSYVQEGRKEGIKGREERRN